MSIEEYRERIKAEKRRMALDAAVVAFLKTGYDCTTLAQIAAGAGISTGTLFKHFPSKASLFAAIMEEMWQPDPRLADPLPVAGDPVRGLSTIGHDYATRLRHPQTEPLFRLIIAEAPRFPELGRALFEHGKASYLERLYAYLRSEIAVGTMAIDDVPMAGRQFFGMINDVIFWPRFLAAELIVSNAEVAKVIREAVLTMMARYGTARAMPRASRRKVTSA